MIMNVYIELKNTLNKYVMLTTKLSDNITEKILKSIDKEAYKYNILVLENSCKRGC